MGKGGTESGVGLVWDVSDACSVLMVAGKDFTLLMALLNGVDKTVAMNTANKLLKWIKEANLFV